VCSNTKQSISCYSEANGTILVSAARPEHLTRGEYPALLKPRLKSICDVSTANCPPLFLLLESLKGHWQSRTPGVDFADWWEATKPNCRTERPSNHRLLEWKANGWHDKDSRLTRERKSINVHSKYEYTHYTGCLTRYRTQHFFNISNTNEDIATKFEQE